MSLFVLGLAKLVYKVLITVQLPGIDEVVSDVSRRGFGGAKFEYPRLRAALCLRLYLYRPPSARGTSVRFRHMPVSGLLTIYPL